MTGIYRFVPNRTFALKDVWPGAVLAGVLTELFSLLFPLYAKVSHGFGTYGQQFALFFLLATWLGFLSQFILIGAVFNKMRLGAPEKRGIVASSPADSREHKDLNDAIENQKREPAGVAILGEAGETRTTAAHPTPGQARVVLGVGIATAAVGAAVSRLRKR